MSHTITVRLDPDLADWLEQQAKRTGESRGKIVRDLLMRARQVAAPSFMQSAGAVRGDKQLSSRKGFAQS